MLPWKHQVSGVMKILCILGMKYMIGSKAIREASTYPYGSIKSFAACATRLPERASCASKLLFSKGNLTGPTLCGALSRPWL